MRETGNTCEIAEKPRNCSVDSQSIKHQVHADSLPWTLPKPNLVILIKMSCVSFLVSAEVSLETAKHSPRSAGVLKKDLLPKNLLASSKRGGEK
ncbi:hypothetical protein [Oscillibacter ruminantium]|uniref:hypothetical protein n=1 Tax=Oscillibacter ruminantium TaxID=1263547 RepID=UPI003332A92E